MNVTPIIARLKSEVPAFSNRVFGSATYALALETELELALPQAFVVPISIDAEPNELMGSITAQRFHEEITVAIVVDNTTDERGQSASESIESLLVSVRNALIGWQDQTGYSDFELRTGEIVFADRARLGWGFNFTTFYDFTEN